jgi:hypothetical protein
MNKLTEIRAISKIKKNEQVKKMTKKIDKKTLAILPDESKKTVMQKENTQNQMACVEQDDMSNMTKEDTKEKIKELEAELKLNTEKLLPGKCPIMLIEREGKIKWEHTVLKEPFSSVKEAYTHLTSTTDYDLANEIIFNGTVALPGEGTRAEKYNIVFQDLADSSPGNATEARLSLQANALYSQGMRYLSRAAGSDWLNHSEFYMKCAIKLLRLHNETIEVLNKCRRGGEQRVIVQHVNVENGGRALVSGQLIGGGGGQQ